MHQIHPRRCIPVHSFVRLIEETTPWGSLHMLEAEKEQVFRKYSYHMQKLPSDKVYGRTSRYRRAREWLPNRLAFCSNEMGVFFDAVIGPRETQNPNLPSLEFYSVNNKHSSTKDFFFTRWEFFLFSSLRTLTSQKPEAPRTFYCGDDIS